MRFRLLYTQEASAQYDALETDKSQTAQFIAVRKTLGLMETNLRHRSLQTHKFDSIAGSNGEEVFEAYAQNKTPAAFRVFWHYGPGRGVITVIAITPHP